MDSDTPRTDEIYYANYEEAGEAHWALYEHACKLERELAHSPEERGAKDAARYRWLRHYLFDHLLKMFNTADRSDVGLDAAIDEMLRSQPQSDPSK